MEGMPRIRLEVENLRYTVMHAVNERAQEFKVAVNDALTKVLESFDLNEFIVAEIQRQMKNSIKTALTRAMSYEMEKYFQDKIRAIIDAHLNQ